ncbi:MAG: MotA/TolQ/ExbB proton channel family protein, partial [Bdellovibrionales bacterium]|nr:MotA/TolQ/ExbB proton channel family protein [Bdellovibrionales bacterium]
KIQENIEKYATFFQGQSNIEAVLQKSQNATLNPMASMLVYAYQAFQKSLKDNQNQNKKEVIEHALMRSKANEIAFLESRISFLATTGSSAPFIGLFGTVWGIMNAFLSISAKGATNLAVVAPGIAEALIATAIGLVAAIPAVIGYNYCVHKIRTTGQSLDEFSSEILDQNLHLFQSK